VESVAEHFVGSRLRPDPAFANRHGFLSPEAAQPLRALNLGVSGSRRKQGREPGLEGGKIFNVRRNPRAERSSAERAWGGPSGQNGRAGWRVGERVKNKE